MFAPSLTKQSLIDYALSLGFEAVGVCSPTPKTWDQYKKWIDYGYQGTMSYLQHRAKERKDPSLLLTDVQSCILVAKNYKIQCKTSIDQKNSPTGRIAQYAWGMDYHDCIREKLHVICDFIHQKSNGQYQSRVFVDSAPVMETDLAAQTAIGWKGKNTILINPNLGQWFLLGGILTTLPLESDKPHPNHCGKCQRCLDQCPTQAFVAPYILDARKCISYWTIEYKGIIPEKIRPLLGNRIFGCDDCIRVCPWNRFAKTAFVDFFHSRPEFAAVPLIEWMKMDQTMFRVLLKGTPIFRLKRKRFLRNVAIALGNSGNRQAIPVLEKANQDSEELIRIHAEWALQQLRTITSDA